MITVVSLVLWATVAAAFWWLAQRQSRLLDHTEALLRNAAKDRHAAGSRTVPPEEPATEPAAETDPNYVRVGQYLVPRDPLIFPEDEPQPGPATEPAAAVLADEWEQQRDAMVGEMLAEIRRVK